MSGPFGDLIATTFGVKNPARQRGDRLSHLNKLGLDLYAASMGVKNPYGQKGGNLAMRKLMMSSQSKIFTWQRGTGIFGTLSGTNMLRDILQKELEKRKKQRGAGLLSIFTRPSARLFGKKSHQTSGQGRGQESGEKSG